jgi:polyisoprenyl-phosphate glycosyltransferase
VPLLTIVVPVFNNAADLPDLLARLRAAATSARLETQIVCVDDGSADDSYAVLARAAESDRALVVLRLSRNFGSNAAILAGLGHAAGDAVCVIAADLQDPPELIPEMVRHWREGAEVVLAARESRDDPPVSRFFASVFNRLFRSLVFRDFPRDGFDFVLLDRRVVGGLTAMPEKHSYLFGQIMWLGFRRAIVHYTREKRRRGTSGWTISRKVKYFIDAFTAFSYLPVRLASVVGFLLAGAGFAYAAVVVAIRLRGGIPVPGFSALMVVLLVVSGTQLVVTGIMGEYLWRILEEVRPRPPFVIAQALNTTAAPGVRTEVRS